MGLVVLGLAGEMIQLVPDGTLLLHVMIIVIMVVVLNRTLFKPINRILEERHLRTQGLLEKSRQTVRSIEEKLTHYEGALRATRAEGYHLLEMQKAEVVREREGQLTAAKEELSKLSADEKQKIWQQVETARKTLATEDQRIALEIGSRILGRPVSG